MQVGENLVHGKEIIDTIRATGHAIRSNCALRACNHFYRCRGIKEDENAAKVDDCVFP